MRQQVFLLLVETCFTVLPRLCFRNCAVWPVGDVLPNDGHPDRLAQCVAQTWKVDGDQILLVPSKDMQLMDEVKVHQPLSNHFEKPVVQICVEKFKAIQHRLPKPSGFWAANILLNFLCLIFCGNY